MFGSYTDKLAILGIFAIVYWIICWLILVSKNERIPGWVSSLAAVVGGLLAFVTAIPSAVFSFPLYLNYMQIYEKISRDEYHRGLNERFSESSKQLQQAHDAGYNEASKYYSKCLKDRTVKLNKYYLRYSHLYTDCKYNPSASEIIQHYPIPEAYDNFLKFHKDKKDEL